MPKSKGVDVDGNGNVAITGGLKITETNPTAEKGVFRWGPISDKPEYYNGTAWVELGGSGGSGGGFSWDGLTLGLWTPAAEPVYSNSPVSLVLSVPTPMTPINLSSYNIQPISKESF